MSLMVTWSAPVMLLKAVASWPISSRDFTGICSSRWPAAIFWACSVSCLTGFVMRRENP